MEAVNTVVSEMTNRGHRFWIDRTGIVGSETWRAKIVEALRNCDAVLFFGSRASYASRHVATELTLAEETGKRIVPVLLDDSPPQGDMPYFLARLHRLKWHAHAPATLLEEIHRALSPASAGFPSSEAPVTPGLPQRRLLPWIVGLSGSAVAAGLSGWLFFKADDRGALRNPGSTGETTTPPGETAPTPDPEVQTSDPDAANSDKKPATAAHDSPEDSHAVVSIPPASPSAPAPVPPGGAVDVTGPVSPVPPSPGSVPPPADALKKGQFLVARKLIPKNVFINQHGKSLNLEFSIKRNERHEILEVSDNGIMLHSSPSDQVWLPRSQVKDYFELAP